MAREWFRPFGLVLMFLLSACASVRGPAGESEAGREPSSPTSHLLVFLTDYGVLDDAVAICKGVMLGVDPRLRIVDLTHQVKPYDIREGGRYLLNASQYYPPGTVFVGVVDPGVGSSRKAIVVKSKRGQYFVVPDNGMITRIADRDGVEAAREATNPAWMYRAMTSTFHGRDIFSPVGAHLAAGEDWTGVGPLIPSVVRLENAVPKRRPEGLSGEGVALDGPFGNLITNVDGKYMKELGYSLGDKLVMKVGLVAVPLHFEKTFSQVPLNQDLAYLDENGLLALATNQGNFAQKHHLRPPVRLFIPVRGTKGSE